MTKIRLSDGSTITIDHCGNVSLLQHFIEDQQKKPQIEQPLGAIERGFLGGHVKNIMKDGPALLLSGWILTADPIIAEAF